MFPNPNDATRSHTTAQAILDEAQLIASQKREATAREIEETLNSARERGKERGYEQGRELRTKVKNFEREILQEIRSGILEKAVDIVKKIVSLEIERFEDATLFVTLKALSAIPDAQHVYLRVNPEDAPVLKANKEKIIHALERGRDVEIRTDKRVERGGIFVQTEYGLIDAQLSTQLEELARVIGNQDGSNY